MLFLKLVKQQNEKRTDYNAYMFLIFDSGKSRV